MHDMLCPVTSKILASVILDARASKDERSVWPKLKKLVENFVRAYPTGLSLFLGENVEQGEPDIITAEFYFHITQLFCLATDDKDGGNKLYDLLEKEKSLRNRHSSEVLKEVRPNEELSVAILEYIRSSLFSDTQKDGRALSLSSAEDDSLVTYLRGTEACFSVWRQLVEKSTIKETMLKGYFTDVNKAFEQRQKNKCSVVSPCMFYFLYPTSDRSGCCENETQEESDVVKILSELSHIKIYLSALQELLKKTQGSGEIASILAINLYGGIFFKVKAKNYQGTSTPFSLFYELPDDEKSLLKKDSFRCWLNIYFKSDGLYKQWDKLRGIIDTFVVNSAMALCEQSTNNGIS